MKAQKEGSTMMKRQPIPIPNASADILREARKSLGLTVGEAASRAGVSESTIRRYERNGMAGSTEFTRFLSVCEAYGIDPRETYTVMVGES